LLVSLMTRESDYQQEQAASAQQAAAGLGCDLQVIFADNNAITQGTQLLKIIQAAPATRPDAIICEPVGGPCLPQVARAAVQAGIPWVLLNRDADYLQEIRKSAPKPPIFTISADQKEVGRIQGRLLAALVRDGAGVLHIQGPSENVVAKDRTTGMQMTLTPGVPVVTLRGDHPADRGPRHNDHAPGLGNRGEASGPGIHDARIVSACRTAGTEVGKVCCPTCLPVADKN
jgi:ABC-type sugar transport system substrate-binding protein